MSDTPLDRLRPWLVALLFIPVAAELTGVPQTLALWFACVLPLVALTLPSLPDIPSALFGVALIAVVHKFQSAGADWPLLLIYETVFLLLLWLGRSAVTEFAPVAGRQWHPEDQFRDSLDRELARARRYERSLVLLSIVRSDCSDGNTPGACSASELRRITSEALRVYAEVHVLGERVLALVPEATPAVVEALTARINGATAACGCAVYVGAASYPEDAHCAVDLQETAEARSRDGRIHQVMSGNDLAHVDETQITT